MPELPEVETVARGLAQSAVGDVIESVWLGQHPEPLKSPAREIILALEGSRIAAVRRAGKHLVMDLERAGSAHPRQENSARAAQFVVHLGMTGRLLIVPGGAEIAKHTHAIAALRSGRELRFVDPRRFGRLEVRPEEAAFVAPGREPLAVTPAAFAALFRGRKTPIKSALLNQKLLAGVGNIYADEALHRAGIRPRRHAGRLSAAELQRLYAALQRVLKQAIAAGGSSVSDYVNAAGERGFFQFEHRVYGRTGEPCRKCRTPIRRLVIAGRSSHWCPKCQR